ncbi:SMI1/KNR4 family protein [Rothia sp. HMSC065D02]|uniref:SMI1/KNR4 family protein n=1 Tax=Rothia sp. HMSC065D02 TaxID=1739518 RepID=UPI000B30FF11|nr:SMI1/KNR4 family protein [Rothia sp. HMSC065D02]
MPIYTPEEYPSVIERIKTKIAQKNISMGPTISEAEIIAFERTCNIRLPQAYRLFLLEVGDGWRDPAMGNISTGSIHRLAEIERKDLSRPLTLTDGWLWEVEDDEEQLTDETFERKLGDQDIELMDEGCGMTYELITAGPCAGEVWSFSDVGVSPCCERQDFLGWFELWLDSDGEATLTISRIMSTKKTNSICHRGLSGPVCLVLMRLEHLEEVLVRR